jgi:hypothetical protein
MMGHASPDLHHVEYTSNDFSVRAPKHQRRAIDKVTGVHHILSNVFEPSPVVIKCTT